MRRPVYVSLCQCQCSASGMICNLIFVLTFVSFLLTAALSMLNSLRALIFFRPFLDSELLSSELWTAKTSCSSRSALVWGSSNGFLLDFLFCFKQTKCKYIGINLCRKVVIQFIYDYHLADFWDEFDVLWDEHDNLWVVDSDSLLWALVNSFLQR